MFIYSKSATNWLSGARRSVVRTCDIGSGLGCVCVCMCRWVDVGGWVWERGMGGGEGD